MTKKKTETVETVAPVAVTQPGFPVVPDDDSFLEILKTTGTQNADDISVISGIKAALATRAGLYDLPKVLTNRMDKTADELLEPVDVEKYSALYELVTERKYAEVLAAIGYKGAAKFVTEKRRQELLDRVGSILLPAAVNFHSALVSYRESLRSSVSEDMALLMATGGLNGASDDVRALITSIPPIDTLKSAAESFVQAVNKTFAKWGVVVARVLAADALRLRKVLEQPDLPRFTGYLSKEQMLTGLGASVTSEDVQLERNIAQYALAVLALNRGLDAANEMKFVRTLATLDSAINWEVFGDRSSAQKTAVRKPF